MSSETDLVTHGKVEGEVLTYTVETGKSTVRMPNGETLKPTSGHRRRPEFSRLLSNRDH